MAGARSTTIRAELTRVVLAAALPVWLASAVLLYEDQADDRALIERDARATARALMVAIDRDLPSARTAAQATLQHTLPNGSQTHLRGALSGIINVLEEQTP